VAGGRGDGLMGGAGTETGGVARTVLSTIGQLAGGWKTAWGCVASAWVQWYQR
jgi:hypothetical protein